MRKSPCRESAGNTKRLLFESECEECSLNKWLTVTETSGEESFQGNEGKGRTHSIKHNTLISGLRKSTDFKDASSQRPTEEFSHVEASRLVQVHSGSILIVKAREAPGEVQEPLNAGKHHKGHTGGMPRRK